MLGKRPIAEIQFADFILPAVNQIISEAAKMRYRSNNDWQCPLTVRAPFGGGVHGGLYHSQSIESIFASTPGLTIVIPSTPYDAKGLLLSSIESNDPVLFLNIKSIPIFKKKYPILTILFLWVKLMLNVKVMILQFSLMVYVLTIVFKQPIF